MQLQQRALVCAPARRWGNSVGLKLAQAFFADPVGRPRRVENSLNPNVSCTNQCFKRFAHVAFDALSGRASRVSRAEVHVAHFAIDAYASNDSEVHHRKGWHLWVSNLMQAVFEV